MRQIDPFPHSKSVRKVVGQYRGIRCIRLADDTHCPWLVKEDVMQDCRPPSYNTMLPSESDISYQAVSAAVVRLE
jgi:hypothetical protein